VESGFARAKNCVNILSKNFVVFAVTSVTFWAIGWGLMFGGDGGVPGGDDYIGKTGLWMVSGADNSPAMNADYKGDYGSIGWAGVPLWAKFFFQLVFAGTAATIVSGAVAERIKYLSFIVFSVLMAIVMYPVTGHWVWGGGWLADAGFWDFAGCAVVHSVGGWAAMTGAFILGPRIGKYGADGKPRGIPGHNMTAAFIGCLVLWLGWFGFNPGSTMGVGDGSLIARIAVNTNAAGAMATLTATATAWIVLGKPDIGMTLNGCLAGLVAITAPCAWVTMSESLIIGAVAGSFVVFSVMFFDKIRCDDPVGATSVHLGCGTLGVLAVGLFAEAPAEGALAPAAGFFHGGGMTQLLIQLKGVLAVGVYTVVVSAICWLVIKYTIGLRVSAEEEFEGLDHGEHGNEAYHGFQMVSEVAR
jgi:Amt family ammonium transporter